MDKDKREHLVGHPSDYGSRTLDDDSVYEPSEQDELERTADGDPLTDRGIADSAISHEQPSPE